MRRYTEQDLTGCERLIERAKNRIWEQREVIELQKANGLETIAAHSRLNELLEELATHEARRIIILDALSK